MSLIYRRDHHASYRSVIDLEPLNGKQGKLYLWSWGSGVRWAEVRGNQIIQNQEKSICGVPFSLVLSHAVFWSSTIPPDIKEALIRHSTLYGDLCFTALWYLSRSHEARQLFMSQPVLFFMILKKAEQEEIESRHVIPLFTSKRRELMAFSGFPSDATLLRLMRKIDTSRFSCHDLTHLAALVRLPYWKRLSHLSKIDGVLLYHIVQGWPLLQARYLMQVDEKWPWARFIYLCTEIRRLCNDSRLGDSRISRCPSIDAIEALHERLSIHEQRRLLDSLPDKKFPLPPIAGNQCILPILSSHELAREGQEMHHCVFSHQKDILRGIFYVYRVVAPERATLGLRIRPDGRWELAELSCIFNQPPDGDTRRVVDRWVCSNSDAEPSECLDKRSYSFYENAECF